MISFAKAQLQGNVGKVEIKETANNKPFARLSIATQESYKVDGEWQNETHWHNVVCFKPATVKFIQNNVPVGRQVFITGDLKSATSEKDGEKKYFYELHVDDIQVGPKLPEGD